ncbi:hypothetical protein ASF76_11465 [Microbacterium sp. Leaf151]|nr:hypothetical protein ASF76_11465 [Microbacterium sp. Leaf151]
MAIEVLVIGLRGIILATLLLSFNRPVVTDIECLPHEFRAQRNREEEARSTWTMPVTKPNGQRSW